MDVERLLPSKRDVVFPAVFVPNSVSLAVILLNLTLLALSWTVVFLRLCTRTFFSRIGRDDWFMVLTLVFFSVFGAVTVSMETDSLQRQPMTVQYVTRTTNLLIVCESFQILGMISLKISLALFFSRILNERWQRKALITIMAITLPIGFGYWLFSIFQCGIPNKGMTFWEKKLSGTCVSDAAAIGLGYVNALVNAGTDISLCCLPIPTIWKTRLSRKEKFIVLGIFVLATTGSIASICRIGFTKDLTNRTPQFWVKIQGLTIVVTIELGLGIIAASLATMRPLLRKTLQIVRTYRSKSSSSTAWPSRWTKSNSGGVKTTKKSATKVNSDNTSDSTLTANSSNRNDKNFLLSATNIDNNFLLSATNANDSLRSFDENPRLESGYTELYMLKAMEPSATSGQSPNNILHPPTLNPNSGELAHGLIHSHNRLAPYDSMRSGINQSPYSASNGRAIFEQPPNLSTESKEKTSLSEQQTSTHPITYPTRMMMSNAHSNISSHNRWRPRAITLDSHLQSTTRGTHGSVETSNPETEASSMVYSPLEEGYRRWVIRHDGYSL